MKKIYLLLCFVACLLASCLEDKGNDLYIELNDVTIGKIRDTTVEQFTRLKIWIRRSLVSRVTIVWYLK